MSQAGAAPEAGSDAFMARFLALHPRKIDLSLDRLNRLLAALGHPERHLPPVIHVAGTNGKGSTVAFLRAMLEADGRRVHVYTSPHLVRFHERIRLGGVLVDEARLVSAFEACERANAGAAITIFEMTTAAALLLFSQEPADVLLLEVGLGGRYDATNVIEAPVATVITPVSMDHVEFLGDTLTKIAGEKAGILKSGAPAIVAAQAPDAERVILAQARRVGAPLTLAGRDFEAHEENGRLVFEDARGLLDLPAPRLPGRHQFANAALAIATLRAMEPDFPISAFEGGLRQVDWPARMQRLSRGALVARAPVGAEMWLDGGHNAAGGQAIAELMGELEEKTRRPLVLIFASLATKDTGGVLAPFAGLAQQVIAVPIPGDHEARDVATVAATARANGLEAVTAGSVESALDDLAARHWATPPRILICGSLYLAGEVLRANGTIPT